MTVKPILQDMLFILYSAYTVYAKAMMRKVIIYMAAFCCVLLFSPAVGEKAFAYERKAPRENAREVRRGLHPGVPQGRFLSREKAPHFRPAQMPGQGYRPVFRNSYKHDEVREAVRRGEIKSLSVIRQSVRGRFPGRILDARLLEAANAQRPMLYDVRVLTRNGRVLSVRVNAHTGQILTVHGR
ncbi:MAG: hypothetical protein CMF31_02900 [Kordiimonas sp.]|nr:hypothetical protein [Kordiimonas sp.]